MFDAAEHQAAAGRPRQAPHDRGARSAGRSRPYCEEGGEPHGRHGPVEEEAEELRSRAESSRGVDEYYPGVTNESQDASAARSVNTKTFTTLPGSSATEIGVPEPVPSI